MGLAQRYVKSFEKLETATSISSTYAGEFGNEIKAPEQIAEDSKKEELQEKSDEDPCQEGYIQIGMKEKDGRMVPNCIPEEALQ